MSNTWRKRRKGLVDRALRRSMIDGRDLLSPDRATERAIHLQQPTCLAVRFRQRRRGVRIRWLKFLERFYQISGQRPNPIEDPIGDRLGDEITGGEHFHPGIEVIDVVE